MLIITVFATLSIPLAVVGLECYNCGNITNPASCITKTVCQLGEVCHSEFSTVGGERRYTLGCKSESACSITIVGRSVISPQDNQCSECCKSGLCNRQLCQNTNPIKCQVCSGPPVICERLHHEETCTYPNNYCINYLVNHDTGARELNRRCGNITTCEHEWYQGTSDNDRCTTFDPKFVQTLDFECTFCCTTDNCNENVVPDKDSLFETQS